MLIGRVGNYLRRLEHSSLLPKRTEHQFRRDSGALPPPLTQLSEEEHALKETVRKFAHDFVRPLVRKMDETSSLDPNIINGVFENGLMGMAIPEKYGGSAASFFSVILTVQELAKIDASVALFVDLQNALVTPFLLEYGSPAQQDHYLPKLNKDWIGCFCVSEAGSGSDAFAMKTTAKEDGDDYVINGQKMWITSSGHANLFFVMANADPAKGHRGITCFLVERTAKGLSVGKPEDKLGLRASSTCPINFDDVRVPKSAILGKVGQGYKIAIGGLNHSRIGIAAQMLGLAEGCFEQTIPYLQERKQFGQRLIDFQGMQHQIADVATDIEAARLLVYNAARLKDAGLPYIKPGAMSKYYAANVAAKTTSKCVEWLGGVGFTKEFPIEKYYRDCKIGAIYEGTNNIQLSTIAKLIDTEFRQ
ncbi:unnamed protein product [Bursaphelenchus xylophilus]|uniref:Short/branched chain specific acyl-CoA dehydrogenase, mitochondrial n=1 Tax=Bursaphelenchus xylophilus TaxID=6326 RepID=A0A1I7SIQ6_BURXY|nr:unnamed protein product [Bursaphelenchus xylophilus]CAG9132339.1 unnamed protein product [Bursaphelenchus xylophilus]